MRFDLGILIIAASIALFMLGKIVNLLAEIRDNTRDTAFYTQRIPINLGS
jgi:hypothetical protein